MFRYTFLILPIALSSCGVIDDLLDSAEVAARADELQEFVDLAEDIDTVLAGGESANIDLLSEESFDERSGTATYNGFAGLVVPDGAGEIALTADADITANFDDNTVGAEFDNWLGIRLNAAGGNDGLAYDATSTVEFSGGEFILNGGDVSFEGTVSGTLETERDDTFTINGPLEGGIGIKSSNGQETIAAGGTDDLVITRNGNEVPDGEFGFGGDRTN